MASPENKQLDCPSNPRHLTQQWPTHDYPMAVAEACVTLYLKTEDDIFLEGIRRWSMVISDQTPAYGGKGAYAEHYGRCIHFLVRAGHVLEDENMIAQASALAQEAVDHLQDGKLFQGYPETHLYESVDGVGYLFLALMYLETGQDLDLYGYPYVPLIDRNQLSFMRITDHDL